MSEPLLTQFARTLARPVSAQERQRARLHLLDWLACIAGARGTEAAELGSAVSMRGWERATYSGNALSLDDYHAQARLHPGSIVWPAALSMPSADMDTRLDAAVRGYEAMIAIGSAIDSHHAEHWDRSASMGVFGACAAFGSLIGFAPVEYANALGNAGSVSGGLQHHAHDDVLTRQWHIFHAVRTGRDAALHVHYGATGPQAVLEGAQGLFAALTGGSGAMPSLEASQGDGWLIGEVSLIEAVDDTGEPQPFACEDAASLEQAVTGKLHKLAKQGQVSASDADKASALALHDNDVDALDTLLEAWTR